MESKKLKILWVARGNGKGEFKSVVKNQFDSMQSCQKIELFKFVLEGKGIGAYLKNYLGIIRYAKKEGVDIIHAHYSLTAILCALTFSCPVFASLMGSDVMAKGSKRWWIRLFANRFWRRVLVKTEEMYLSLGVDSALVIPNGVDLDFYYPMPQSEAQKALGWNNRNYHIVFPSNPVRSEKNFALLDEAIGLVNDPEIQVHTMIDLSRVQVRQYFAASDLIVLSSLREGSPNAIKEALAMNKVVISTDVGDVRQMFQNLMGVKLVGHNCSDLANAIVQMKSEGIKVSDGRSKMLGLSSQKIAQKIEEIYFSMSRKGG
ncbi:MAG: glycosyltransferase family 4 protein [Bacteroidetes bacterium]|nr:glycosyltransferase family 4 protein [Bacteroidota bacterium]